MLLVLSVKRRQNYHLRIIYDDNVLNKSSYEPHQFYRATKMPRLAIFTDCLCLIVASLVYFQFPVIGGLSTGNRVYSVLRNSLFGIGSVNRSKPGRWEQSTDGVAPDGVSVEPVEYCYI